MTSTFNTGSLTIRLTDEVDILVPTLTPRPATADDHAEALALEISGLTEEIISAQRGRDAATNAQEIAWYDARIAALAICRAESMRWLAEAVQA